MDEASAEVLGSRTVQPTQVEVCRADEIAYRDLQPGEGIQAGDEWQAQTGQWHKWSVSFPKTLHHGQCKARRPFNITELLKQRDQASHEYRAYREALTTEQAAHKITMANGLQACRERDDAEQALKMARAELEETCRHRNVVIEERNEAERQCQHLRTALEELQRRRDAATGVETLTVGEVVENILSALEIAGHALEYLADVGVNEEAGHYSGFGAAIAVVRKIKESTK